MIFLVNGANIYIYITTSSTEVSSYVRPDFREQLSCFFRRHHFLVSQSCRMSRIFTPLSIFLECHNLFFSLLLYCIVVFLLESLSSSELSMRSRGGDWRGRKWRSAPQSRLHPTTTATDDDDDVRRERLLLFLAFSFSLSLSLSKRGLRWEDSILLLSLYLSL